MHTVITDFTKWSGENRNKDNQNVTEKSNSSPNSENQNHKRSKIDSEILSNQSITTTTTTASIIGSSELRKLWRETTEGTIKSYQNTIATVCFTPAEIAIFSLKLSLTQQKSLHFLTDQFGYYLQDRYGSNFVTDLSKMEEPLVSLLQYEKEALSDNDTYENVKNKLNL